MADLHINAPLSKEDAAKLRAGDVVFLSGKIYTARDAAHRRLMALIEQKKELPFNLEGAVIYYVGPSPAPEGRPIGSAGPTTSYRMDSYTPKLHSLGVKATIGKGKRGDEVRKALQDYGCVYFGATGGVGAMLSMCITDAKVIAFEDLGPEAISELTIKNFPLLVINDSVGGNLHVQPNLKAVGLE